MVPPKTRRITPFLTIPEGMARLFLDFFGERTPSRAGFGALAETVFLIPIPEKVRDREGAITSTRGARSPRSHLSELKPTPSVANRTLV
jgi:hypothetical protein